MTRMNPRAQPYARLFGLAAGLVLAFVALAVWVAAVQVGPLGPAPAREGVKAPPKALIPARRGSILDVRGHLLATSTPVKTVCADPVLVGAGQAGLVARTLAPILELPELELAALLWPRTRTNELGQVWTNRYVVLKHKVPLDRWQQATQAMASLYAGVDERKLKSRELVALRALRERAVHGVDDQLRQYPSGPLAAHVLGFVSSRECAVGDDHVFEMSGVAGIERTFDRLLNGAPGWVQKSDEVAPRSGLNVVLTLDAGLQHIVEQELERARREFRAASVCAIVMVPKTGEILALANAPTFDPNRPGDEPSNHWNHVVGSLHEPGSTFKVVPFATALDDRILRLEDTVHCENGTWQYADLVLHDHKGYGVLTYEAVLVKSSNIGTAKAAVRLGKARLYHSITNFGFGVVTGIPLPGEAAGVVYPPHKWSKVSITRVPIGHEVSATPLQMCLAMSAIANGGWLLRPVLVDRLEDFEGRVVTRFPRQVNRRVIGERAAAEMQRALVKVASEDGTAAAASLEYYTVAGKTGTAEKFANGTYKSGKYYSSFVGYFPAEDPALCILVAVDEPDRRVGHYGGRVAAPVFRAIAERAANYLRIPSEGGSEPPGDPAPRWRPEPPNDWAGGGAYAAAGRGRRGQGLTAGAER